MSIDKEKMFKILVCDYSKWDLAEIIMMLTDDLIWAEDNGCGNSLDHYTHLTGCVRKLNQQEY